MLLHVITVLDMSKISNIIDFDACLVFVRRGFKRKTSFSGIGGCFQPLTLTAVKTYHIDLFFIFFCINLLINLSPKQKY